MPPPTNTVLYLGQCVTISDTTIDLSGSEMITVQKVTFGSDLESNTICIDIEDTTGNKITGDLDGNLQLYANGSKVSIAGSSSVYLEAMNAHFDTLHVASTEPGAVITMTSDLDAGGKTVTAASLRQTALDLKELGDTGSEFAIQHLTESVHGIDVDSVAIGSTHGKIRIKSTGTTLAPQSTVSVDHLEASAVRGKQLIVPPVDDPQFSTKYTAFQIRSILDMSGNEIRHCSTIRDLERQVDALYGYFFDSDRNTYAALVPARTHEEPAKI